MESIESSPSILHVDDPDLAADAAAHRAVKNEVVSVEFAELDGELSSAVGVNRYARGDALITGSTGDRWSVARQIFDAKYDPQFPTLRGEPGHYRNRPLPVLAKRIDQAFTVSRSVGGDTLHGAAGDWLIQYSPGDFGVVENTRFRRVYVIVEDASR